MRKRQPYDRSREKAVKPERLRTDILPPEKMPATTANTVAVQASVSGIYFEITRTVNGIFNLTKPQKNAVIIATMARAGEIESGKTDIGRVVGEEAAKLQQKK
ncbi:Uncharacterised protein [uncultured archaeon]|nr:Uncharacterised protein [uncultured archaeon]